MYLTVAELRAEGVTEAQADDERAEALIEAASAELDQLTGWFFEPRALTLTLSGRGTRSLELPAPPIQLERVVVDGAELHHTDLFIVGAPVLPGFDGARLSRRSGRFTRGIGNVVVEGRFGYTEPDGSAEGQTPLMIRRACALLVLRYLYPLADDRGFDVRNRWRVLEERTRDQSYKLDRVGESVGPTGDPELDSIIARYRRPPPMGAC